jgi:hypothetical protein
MKKPNPSDKPKTNPAKDTDKGYPPYPENDDIYNQAKEEKDIDPDDLSKIKSADDKWEIDPDEELDIDGDLLGDDLDVPGSELDDDDEAIGNEDEENNYYSIGGDRHEDLEESDE